MQFIRVTRIPSKMKNYSLKCFETYLEIRFPDTTNLLQLYNFWLRDHCRCSQCYDSNTDQISSDLLSLSLDIKPLECHVIQDKLKITWEDMHESEFLLSWLQELYFPQSKSEEVVLWNQSNINDINDNKISVTDFFKDQNGVKHLLTSLKKYGFGFVTGVEPTIEATESVAKQVGFVQETIFGKMWYVGKDQPYRDTAYTNIALGVHTDNTYFSDAAGLQIFHMLDSEGTGGESILVDGFKAADVLKKTNPLYYEVLCNTVLESQYIDKNSHYYDIGAVIKLHALTQKPLQIRYNSYDRAPLVSVPPEKLLTFYKAYQTFGKILSNSESEFRIKLAPGTMLFFDNWRLLHGRTAFTGNRVLCGCYISRDEWMSKSRVLGINII